MNNAIEIRRYVPQEQAQWDSLIMRSANGTFLFLRGYMEYHAHRFEDFSLMIYHKGALVALLPANRTGNTVTSHGGLTYGGVITDATVTSALLLDIFDAIAHYLRQNDIAYFDYKLVPHIYHSYPHEAEQYALFRMGAVRTACSLSSAIDLTAPLRYAELRRRGVKRATQCGVQVVTSDNYAPFWHILESNLQERHQVKPVHSLEEITLLHNRFPQQIRLHTALLDGETVAGCVVYNTGVVAHAQYISASEQGKECGALDMLFAHLIEQEYSHCRYFDFGISTEKGGAHLNSGLLAQKEGFGARGIIYETYRITL